MQEKFKITYAIVFLVFGLSSLVYADTERDIAIDQAIAGMEEGSRMLAPDSLDMPGTALSPAGDTNVIISPEAQKERVSQGIEAEGGGDPGGVVSGLQETGGGTTEPIIDVDVGVDLDSGTVDADVGVNPGGDQLLDADLTESAGGSEGEAQIDIGSAVDIPVEDNIGDPEEPTDETSSPIIDIDASADLDSGTVDADLGINPSGDQLLDADVGATGADTTTDVEADVGGTSDLTEPVAPVVAEPVVVAPPAGLSAEVDTTGETVGGETDIGIEADVSGTGAGEDIVDDPTDDGFGGL